MTVAASASGWRESERDGRSGDGREGRRPQREADGRRHLPGRGGPARDCPVPRCLGLFKGQGSTWAWDWGTADSEMQRLYVLDGKDGAVLIMVDSLDGTTFESVTTAADAILASVKFDQ